MTYDWVNQKAEDGGRRTVRRLSEVDRLKNEVIDLKAEIGSLRSEVGNLKSEVKNQKMPVGLQEAPTIKANVVIPEIINRDSPVISTLPSKAAVIEEKQARAREKIESLRRKSGGTPNARTPAKIGVAPGPASPLPARPAVANPYAAVAAKNAAAEPSANRPTLVLEADAVDPGIAKAAWDRELLSTSLINFTLEEAMYASVPAEYLRKMEEEYVKKRRQFVAEQVEQRRADLERLGLSGADIDGMKSGRLPINYTVMLKIPHTCGGTNDFSNMLLIQTRPFAREAESIIVQQISYNTPPAGRSRRVWLPVYRGPIYIPPAGLTGSGGVSTSIDPAVKAAAMQGQTR